MNTRSVKSSQVSALGTSSGEADETAPSAVIESRHGPASPNCSQADDAPGPPLNRNVTGLVPRSVPSSV
jgi:hypothetical protein